MAKTKFSKLVFAVSLLWLLGIVFASVPVFANGPNVSGDIVFCPLQNQWVKRNAEAPTVRRTPFTDLCAGSQDKDTFINKLILKVARNVSFGDRARAEAIFFDYKASGEISFSELPSKPDLPSPPQASVSKVINAVNGIRIDPSITNTQVHWQRRTSRRQTCKHAVKFSRKQLRDLQPISIAVKPRGPPVS